MKKFLIILVSLLVLIVAAVVVLPIVFKDDIKQALDDTMDENLNATVFYDVGQFSLSLIKNFPDITVSMGDFGIVGRGEFKQDTLVSVGSFDVTVNLMSAITGDQIKVEEILLDQPKISVLVLADGKANYDIAKPSESSTELEEATTPEETDASGSDLSIAIKRWAISDGQMVYKDESLDFYTSLVGLKHEGSGDFTLDVFDLTTNTVIEAASLGFEGIEYASDKRIEIDLTLNMNLPEMQFSFKENRIAVNDFAMGAEGNISMKEEDIKMDITFEGKDIDLRSILSLIPGVYQEYLDGVTAGGIINFAGLVKGTYNESSMPKIGATFSVDNGSISYSAFDIPIEKLNIKSSFDYPSADLTETRFNIDRFSMLVDGEQLEAYLKFKDLENYTWDFGFTGNADLEKITNVVPLEGMTLKGKINAGLKSAGNMAMIEAEKYTELPTTGSLSIDSFFFSSSDLPQGFGITKAEVTLNPQEINLAQFDATSGNSDFAMKGKIENYLGFALSEEEVLKGSLSLKSGLLDLNEFIPEYEESEEEIPEDTSTLEVVKIPENIDFTFSSSIDQIAVSNLEMKNFEGKVLVKDGAIRLDENTFNMLDGTFTMTGSYITKDLDQPKYDLGFKVQNLSIGSAFESFSTIQQYVPIAKQVTGSFSTEFKVDGLLGSDMMPIMDAINLDGLVNVAQATLSSGSFVTKLNALTSLNSGANSSGSGKSLSLKDVLVKTAIKDGRLFVEPFNLEVQGQKATLGGSNSLEGALDYSMLVKEIPTGAVGNALSSAVSSITGQNNLISGAMDIDIGIGGTYDDVKLQLLGASPSGSTGTSSATAVFKQQMASKVDEEKAKAEEELEKKKEEQRQKIVAEAQKQAEKIRAEGKASAEKVRQEGYAAADKLISDAGSNPLKKKVATEAAKKLKSETDKKADKIEAESNKKADQVIAKAKEQAAGI